MPRLSLLGVPVMMGPGAGPMRCWLDSDTWIEQVCDAGGCRLVTTTVATGQQMTVAHRGANWLVAGGGVWAARLQGYGYFDSLGRMFADAMPLAVDPTDGVVLIGNYATGAGVSLVARDGTITPVYPGVLMTQQGDLVAGDAVFRAAGVVQLWPAQQTMPDMANPRYAYGSLTANAPKGLAWFPWQAPGVLLSGDGRDFNPDVMPLPSGLIRVVSSATAGEGPADLRVYDIDPIRGTVNGKPWVPYASTPEPPQPEPPDPQPEPPKPEPEPPKPDPPKPEPPVRPFPMELLMQTTSLTLKRDQFKTGSVFPERKLYPDITNPKNNLSINTDGSIEPGGRANNGPSESFVVGDKTAFVDFGGYGYSLLVQG